MMMSVNNVGMPRHVGESVANKNILFSNFLGYVTEQGAVGRDFVSKAGHGHSQIADKKLRAGTFGQRIVGKEDAQNGKITRPRETQKLFL